LIAVITASLRLPNAIALKQLALQCAVCYSHLRAYKSGMGNMSKINVTVRLDRECVAFLDTLGKNVDRDRSYLIKDAVNRYIEIHRWQIEEIKKAVAEADAGEFASEEEVEAMFDELTR
jgi:predicted transcriptional regulator